MPSAKEESVAITLENNFSHHLVSLPRKFLAQISVSDTSICRERCTIRTGECLRKYTRRSQHMLLLKDKCAEFISFNFPQICGKHRYQLSTMRALVPPTKQYIPCSFHNICPREGKVRIESRKVAQSSHSGGLQSKGGNETRNEATSDSGVHRTTARACPFRSHWRHALGETARFLTGRERGVGKTERALFLL